MSPVLTPEGMPGADPDWIAVDWGTSRLRAWAMDAAGAVLAQAQSDAGMGGLSAEGFEAALLAAVGPWLGADRTPVLACGMVGARQGWVEAAYRDIPAAPVGRPLTPAPTTDPRIEVRIIPGLRQIRPAPDVMRGEETQIAGLLLVEPGFDGIACLPGTHAKWATVSAGEITAFQTAMIGEIFALLSMQSVLRHSVDPGTADDAAFDDGVAEALARPETLVTRLFGIRAEGLTQGLSPADARGRLSGLLIGAELAATKPWWLGRDVVLIGAGALSALYTRALAAQGVTTRTVDAENCTLDGLRAARTLWSAA